MDRRSLFAASAAAITLAGWRGARAAAPREIRNRRRVAPVRWPGAHFAL